jgi:hypothetical protein
MAAEGAPNSAQEMTETFDSLMNNGTRPPDNTPRQ